MENIVENNRLIAEFMGFEKGFGTMYNNCKIGEERECFFLEDFKYHSDWNWLMPVVKKIYFLDIYYEYANQLNMFSNGVELSININRVYEQVIDFITWYNQNK